MSGEQRMEVKEGDEGLQPDPPDSRHHPWGNCNEVLHEKATVKKQNPSRIKVIEFLTINFEFEYIFLRNLNEPCQFLDFFDNHDMWHFISASGLFLAFIFLLTIDDDLLITDRKKILVF